MKNMKIAAAVIFVCAFCACGGKSNAANEGKVAKNDSCDTVAVKKKIAEPLPANNYIWKGTCGKMEVMMAYTVVDGIVQGEFVNLELADLSPRSFIGRKNEEGNFFFRGFLHDGTQDISIDGTVDKDGNFVGDYYGSDVPHGAKLLLKPNKTEPKYKMGRRADCYCSPFVEDNCYTFKGNPAKIAGKYHYIYTPDDSGAGDMTIKLEKGGMVSFDIECTGHAPSYNIASAEGKAKLNGNRFTYKMPDCDYKFEVLFIGDYAMVNTLSGTGNGCFGMGMSVEEIYIRDFK